MGGSHRGCAALLFLLTLRAQLRFAKSSPLLKTARFHSARELSSTHTVNQESLPGRIYVAAALNFGWNEPNDDRVALNDLQGLGANSTTIALTAPTTVGRSG